MDFLMRFNYRQLSFKSSKTTQQTTLKSSDAKQLHEYTLKEVAQHCTIDSCWMVICDRVYDLTDFIELHPGGYELMIEYAGADATNAFMEKPHTIDATAMLEKYLIGELVPHDRMFLSSS